MNNTFIGRKNETELIRRYYDSPKSEMIAVYGRRRVGKTFLIKETMGEFFDFEFVGMYKTPAKIQRELFQKKLNSLSGDDKTAPKDWYEAFDRLSEYLLSLKKKKVVVFLDELPWMDNMNSRFLSAFSYFWNNWNGKKVLLKLFVCGSATAWMDKKIANNKGGLFHRQTCKLYLESFNLHDVEQYLLQKKISWSHYDIAECYMIMGGIPYYLSLLDNSFTLKQNIDRLFFKKHGELWDEFDHLYKTLFTNSDKYEMVVEALSTKKGGLSRDEIIKKTGINSGGDLSRVLNDLVKSGFVRVVSFYERRKKDALYQLADYYTLFYFKYIKNNYGKDEHFWLNATDNPSRRAWSGLAFEQVCMDHILQIKRKLEIGGVLSNEYAWSIGTDEEKGIDGAQIDLILDRRDRVVSICEIKYSIKPFGIDKDYDIKLRNKIGTFVTATDCTKTVQLVMVTTYGLKDSKYNSIVNAQILLDDLFKE